MPRSQGTSRKGKPKKNERAAGMGRALEKAQQKRFKPKANGSASHLGGMAKAQNTTNIGIDEFEAEKNKMKSVLEMDSLTDFLGQAEMAGKEFTSERERYVYILRCWLKDLYDELCLFESLTYLPMSLKSYLLTLKYLRVLF